MLSFYMDVPGDENKKQKTIAYFICSILEVGSYYVFRVINIFKEKNLAYVCVPIGSIFDAQEVIHLWYTCSDTYRLISDSEFDMSR